jgi:integrase
MPAINVVSVREKLSPQREPYWLRITQGRFIGFRKMRRGAAGTWIARFYDGEGGYSHEALGDFADLPEKDRYDAAKKAAEQHFSHLDLGGSTEPGTVKEACGAYLTMVETERGERAKLDTEGYFNRLVYGDPIARVKLSKLSKSQMFGWRDRVLEHNDDRSSFNRNVTPLRAALNLARDHGKVATNEAWRVALRPFKKKEVKAQRNRSRTLTLNPDERRKLIEKASDEARPFFKALALLPMRPGEVAGLKVEFLNVRERRLDIKGKTGVREIPLPVQAFNYFKECAKGKLPSAWLIARADGSQWKKEQWRDEIKDAARKAKLPKATVAYTLRYSLLTELVVGGFDLLTIANAAGTSVLMLQEHYGHPQEEHTRKALATLTLTR